MNHALRLHIGCGRSRIEEFVNIDVRPTATTDLVTQAWDLRELAADSVSYIYARHMLEHLSIGDAARTMAEWFRVLQVGGIVHVVVPNLMFHAGQILGLERCDGHASQEQHAFAGFYGWQRDENGGEQEDAHRWGYTPASLARLLTTSGLTVTDGGIAQLIDRDVEPWHINMRAIKESA